jgi:hypothetical protein
MLERLKAYETGKRPQQIAECKPTFFDPRTGEPIVWYYRSKDNSKIQIFDLMGFHPDTGAELIPVSDDIAEQWTTQCAEATRYLPKRIMNPENYIFFDLRTGDPRAWYWQDSSGSYEFYDSQGFQPQTGDKLLVVTREVVDAWLKAHGNAPQPVDPNKYPFFDPNTGAARVWYWHGGNGAYEFYDASGFHPQTGDRLLIVTHDVVDMWKKDLEKKKKDDDAAKKKLEEKTQLENQAADRCDQLAANPNDRAKPANVDGVEYNLLRAQSTDAIASCEIAATNHPDQLRFRYQLARSLETTDDKANLQKALAIFKRLVDSRYPAAFDNLGSVYLSVSPLLMPLPLLYFALERN